jgi:hypothetical protein
LASAAANATSREYNALFSFAIFGAGKRFCGQLVGDYALTFLVNYDNKEIVESASRFLHSNFSANFRRCMALLKTFQVALIYLFSEDLK